MIPQQLSLENFMCYSRAELDFAGIHVACLAGENGAGKSALLDAVTWALWGRSRLGARGDDDLIRLGEDEMTVELTFGLGGDRYRVMRQRKAGKRGRSMLDFQVRDGDRWRPLVEGGVRATQEKIENILRLDYDTFINSAFLRQGRADEFTVKTAAERKRVLGEILGLDRWTIYEDRVKERQKAIETEAEAIRLRLEEIEAELARRSEYEAQVKSAQAAVDELDSALEAAQDDYQQIEAARTELQHKESQIGEQDKRIEQAEQELAELAEERARREEQLSEHEELLIQKEEIEAGYETYQQAVEREKALGAKLRQSVELSERRAELKERISEARHQLEARREVLTQRIKELEERLPGDALLAEHREVQSELERLTELSENQDAVRDELADVGEERATLKARNGALRREMNSLKEKLDLLERADAHCPLCEQSLTDEHRRRLVDQIQAEGKEKGGAYRANRAEIEDLTDQAQSLERRIGENEKELRELPGLQRQAAALAERVEQGQQAAEELEGARAELSEVEQQLAEETYAPEARDELEQVLAEAEELGYDADAHDEVRQVVSEKQVFAERKAQLDSARASLKENQAALERLEESEQRWREQVEAAQERRAALEREVEELHERLEDAEAVEEELQRVRKEAAEARQRLGAAQQRLEACKSLEEQQADKLKRQEELKKDASLYDDLRTAFSVRGVPAMVIEAAVPEIEDEANRLLSRMTNGRMHVRFDTQRETKAGEVREALEIKISDELGTRPYENYSGGEQFRVNFAIRIALSKLLARRAGAQLQTLVIDEGFGTQDAQGRQRLVEAINTIQEDFARVLVITHISELKDAFPARVEVTKTPEGSTVEVV